MELDQQSTFQHPACSSRWVERFSMFFNAHGWFLGVKNSKNHFRVIWRHWPLMTRWLHALISSHLSVKWMSDSKSATQIILESSRTRRKSAMIIDLVWPQLTSVDLHMTGLPVGCVSTTWYYMSTFISLAKTAMFASYRLKCATEHIYRMKWSQLWRRRSHVRGSGYCNFKGRREKEHR